MAPLALQLKCISCLRTYLLPAVKQKASYYSPYCFDKYYGEICDCGFAHVYLLLPFLWYEEIEMLPLSDRVKHDLLDEVLKQLYGLSNEEFYNLYM